MKGKFEITREVIKAKPRKISAKWMMEHCADIRVYEETDSNLSDEEKEAEEIIRRLKKTKAEREKEEWDKLEEWATEALSKEIAQEIDNEILAELKKHVGNNGK